MLHRPLLAVLSLLLGCVADETLPIEDLCVVKDGKEDPKVCVACASDADCAIGGNPCCHPMQRWTCGHVDALEKQEPCVLNDCSKPPVPASDRCRCLEGRCHAR